MPNYHCSVKVISRSSGRSATAAAAYRSGERIHDEREDRTHNYEPRGGVQYSEIMRPEQSPDRWDDRSTLWNEVERVERRCDARVAREVEVSLPCELNRNEQVALLREYTRENFVARGMVADVNIHDRNDGNPHAHIMLTTRSCDREGFGKKDRTWNDRENVQRWRESWERSQNAALTRKYEQQRTPENQREYVDCRSYAARGDARTPQHHMGAERTQIENQERERCKREGLEYKPVTEVGRENEAIREINRMVMRAQEIARELSERAREKLRSYADRIREVTNTPYVSREENREHLKELLRAEKERENQIEVVRGARERGIDIDRNVPLSEQYNQAKAGLEAQDREHGLGWER